VNGNVNRIYGCLNNRSPFFYSRTNQPTNQPLFWIIVTDETRVPSREHAYIK